jgi:hypothetical protein
MPPFLIRNTVPSFEKRWLVQREALGQLHRLAVELQERGIRLGEYSRMPNLT